MYGERSKANFLAAAAKIKSLGFRVVINDYTRDKYGAFYYGYYSDGQNVGYFQNGDFYGVRWSTVNAPGSVGVGSGFSCEDYGADIENLTREQLLTGFAVVPSWYRLRKGEKVVKYRNFDEFLEARKKSPWSDLIEF